MRTIRPRTLAVLAAAGVLTLLPGSPALAHAPSGDRGVQEKREAHLAGVPAPVVSRPNVHLVAIFPDTPAIADVFARSAPYFYTGLIYKAMGFPTRMFTVLFALGRLPGWIAQWREMMSDPATKISRPRQVYIGATEREYRPAGSR